MRKCLYTTAYSDTRLCGKPAQYLYRNVPLCHFHADVVRRINRRNVGKKHHIVKITKRHGGN